MNSLYKAFGILVRSARIKADMTQEDLGKRLDLSRTAITGIEKGKQGVSLLQLYELATHLKVQPQELLPKGGFETPFRMPVGVQELISQQSDQELLIKMIEGRTNATRSKKS